MPHLMRQTMPQILTFLFRKDGISDFRIRIQAPSQMRITDLRECADAELSRWVVDPENYALRGIQWETNEVLLRVA